MKNIIEKIKKEESKTPFDSKRMLKAFNERLAKEESTASQTKTGIGESKKKNKELIKKMSMSWGISMIPTLALVLVVGIFFSQKGRFISSAIVKSEIPLIELKEGHRYIFKQKTGVLSVARNQVSFSSDSKIKMIKKEVGLAQFELRHGSIDVDNQTGNLFKNAVEVEQFIITELGTKYTIDKDDKVIRLKVTQGLINIENHSHNWLQKVEPGEVWIYDIESGEERHPVILKNNKEEVDEEWLRKEALRKAKVRWKNRRKALIEESNTYFESKNILHVQNKKTYRKYLLKDLSLIEEIPLKVPERIKFIKSDEKFLTIATHSEYFYFFDKSYRRTSIKPGHLTANNVFYMNNQIWIVNASGELLIYSQKFKFLKKVKIAKASLWEGLKIKDRYMVLPGVDPKLIIVDSKKDLQVKEYPLPSPAVGALQVTGLAIGIPVRGRQHLVPIGKLKL